MSRLAYAVALCMLMACGGPGANDGKCLAAAVGTYRCIGNKAEICEIQDRPEKNPPQWYIIEDCSAATISGVSACVALTDQSAACSR